MNERTLQLIRLFQSMEWFSAVGDKSTTQAIVVGSWWDAAQSCVVPTWYNTHFEARKSLSQQLVLGEKQRNMQWNDLVEDIKVLIHPIVDTKIIPLLVNELLIQDILNSIRYDLVMIAMCTEYSDIHLPSFYVELACWYAKGRFPCGWKGRYPQGQLIVF